MLGEGNSFMIFFGQKSLIMSKVQLLHPLCCLCKSRPVDKSYLVGQIRENNGGICGNDKWNIVISWVNFT